MYPALLCRNFGNQKPYLKTLTVGGFLLWTAAAFAQKPIYFDYPQTSDKQQVLHWDELPKWLSFDGQVRGRTEGQTSNNEVSGNDRIYELSRVRGGVTVEPTSFLRGYLQFQDTHALGLPVPQVNANMRDSFDLFQGYLDIHVHDVDVVTGRQMLRFGSERLVGISDWTNNSRTWDGFDGHFGNKNWLEAFATSVVAVHPTSLDTHGAGLTFYGVVGTLTTVLPKTQLQPFNYIRRVNNVTGNAGVHGNELEDTFGIEANGHVLNGFYYDVMGALQRGHYPNESIHSGAGYVKAGYQATGRPWKPRFSGEYDFASGDAHRSGERVSTFDQLYPSNHNAFGLVDLFGFQNITEVRGNIDLNPVKSLTLLFQTELLHVAAQGDSVYGGAAAVLVKAPAGGFRADDIGQGFDASGAYRVNEYLLVQAGVGHLFPGRVLAENGKAAPLTLGYLQLEYRFKAVAKP